MVLTAPPTPPPGEKEQSQILRTAAWWPEEAVGAIVLCFLWWNPLVPRCYLLGLVLLKGRLEIVLIM